MRPFSRSHALSRLLRRIVPAILALLLFAAIPRFLVGQDRAPSIFVTAREAVAEGRTDRTDMAGDRSDSAIADDAPSGGILVGFEIGLADHGNHQSIQALRPIYLTSKGDLPSGDFGAFSEKRGGKNVAKGRVLRTIQVRARPSYAVGEIALVHGIGLDAMRITFMKINGASLNPGQSYTEGWFGSHHNRKPTILSGGGAPIVGIMANKDENRITGLGLVKLRASLPAPPPAPPAPEVVKRPTPPPTAPPRQPEPIPPRLDPLPRPVDRAPAVAPKEEEKPLPDEEEEDEPVPPPPPPVKEMDWLPYAVFGGVTLPLLLGLMFVFKGREPRKEEGHGPKEGEMAWPDRKRRSAVAEKGEPESTALSTAPLSERRPRRRDEENDEDLPLALPANASTPARQSQAPPPFFTVRTTYAFKGNGLYRIYVLPDELLFLDAGPDPDAPTPTTQIITALSLMFGGVLGLFIARSVMESLPKSAAPRRHELDDLDLDELIDRASRFRSNFRATPEELTDASIEAPSFWQKLGMGKMKYAGTLSFRHRTGGKHNLQLLSLEDMKLALELMPPLLEGRLRVNAFFSKADWQYVRR